MVTRLRMASGMGLGFVLAGLFGCSSDNPPTGPDAASLSALQAHRAAIMAGGQVRSREAADALARVAWVGEVHNAAMRDVVNNTRFWLGNDVKNRARVCAGVARLVRKYQYQMPEVHRPLNLADADRRLAAAMAAAAPSCESTVRMNVFTLSSSSGELAEWELRGRQYVDDLAAMDGWGSVSDFEAVGNYTLNNATHLPVDEYDMLATVVSVGNSSISQWDAYESSGGQWGENFGGWSPEQLYLEPMSIFFRGYLWPFMPCCPRGYWRVALADVAGGWLGRYGGAALAAEGAVIMSLLEAIK